MRRAAIPVALAFVLVLTGAACAQDRSALHLVSVGINDYPLCPLRACVKDATDVRDLFAAQSGKAFGLVSTTLLLDDIAAGDKILAAISAARKAATPESCTVLYLSGHGGGGLAWTLFATPLSSAPFHFCAHDRDLGWGEIQAALRVVPGKVLVILDTCHAGAAAGGRNVTVFCSCAANECASEDQSPGGNGHYTKLLVAGLAGEADADGDGRITAGELEAYLAWHVRKKTNGHQCPKVIPPLSEPGLGQAPLAVLKSLPWMPFVD